MLSESGQPADILDNIVQSSASEVKLIPVQYSLQQNFPNPFNPSTEIRFNLPSDGFVNLEVYNLTGQKVKTLESRNMQPGYHSVIWDGTNYAGEKVSTGMYFYMIQTDKFHNTKKMLFLK